MIGCPWDGRAVIEHSRVQRRCDWVGKPGCDWVSLGYREDVIGWGVRVAVVDRVYPALTFACTWFLPGFHAGLSLHARGSRVQNSQIGLPPSPLQCVQKP